MSVSITPYEDTAPRRSDEPEFVAERAARKAKAAQRIKALGKPINKPTRVSHKTKIKRVRLEARDD